jgi:hypothetical protein
MAEREVNARKLDDQKSYSMATSGTDGPTIHAPTLPAPHKETGQVTGLPNHMRVRGLS